MSVRVSRKLALDLAATGLLLIAAGLLVHDRLLPALAERARVDPGETLGDGFAFRDLVSGDTLRLVDDAASLVVVFRSTCPVCEETAPDWASLARLGADRVFAVGLDRDTTAIAWVEERLDGRFRAVTPIEPGRFLDRLRIEAVPTTLLFEGRTLTFARIGPLQPDDHARIRRAFPGPAARTRAPVPRLQPGR